MDVDVDKPMAKVHYTQPVSFSLGDKFYLAMNEHAKTLPIAYKSWRVVAFGFIVMTNGGNGQPAKTEFGIGGGDGMGVGDSDSFGVIEQDDTLGKYFSTHDVFIYDPFSFLSSDINPLDSGGTPTVTVGPNFGVWQTKVSTLLVIRNNVYELGILPYICIEVRR